MALGHKEFIQKTSKWCELFHRKRRKLRSGGESTKDYFIKSIIHDMGEKKLPESFKAVFIGMLCTPVRFGGKTAPILPGKRWIRKGFHWQILVQMGKCNRGAIGCKQWKNQLCKLRSQQKWILLQTSQLRKCPSGERAPAIC